MREHTRIGQRWLVELVIVQELSTSASSTTRWQARRTNSGRSLRAYRRQLPTD